MFDCHVSMLCQMSLLSGIVCCLPGKQPRNLDLALGHIALLRWVLRVVRSDLGWDEPLLGLLGF